MHRFASLGLKSRIDVGKRMFPGKSLHRFASLGLKSRIDARSSRSSARIPRHPPSSSPSTRSSRAEARVLPWTFCMGWARAGLTVAAKAGADAPGGGISLCFCRRGCAAPAQKAATLNAPRCNTRHAQRPSPQHPPKKPPRSTTLAAAPATLNLEVRAAPSGRRAAFFGAEGS